ncbi:ATP-binding protein [Tabrizicola sp.]|uniref:ATP-binding protein n=1 Tax=Tabrizicola sp. TaxID=2005166 RepID=UPI003F39D4C4
MTKGDIEAGGGRRQVTAVFIDLENFSAIASEADAEDLQSWLDDYYRQTRILVEASGGEVTEYLGDGVVAIFGLSRTEELTADRAVDAALRAVQSIRLSYQNRIAVRLRAGVATGEVVVRPGPERDGLPRLTGSVTTLAERIQSEAEPGTVVIAEETRALSRGRFETRALGPRRLKGFTDEMVLFEVLGRLPAGGIDQPETFVGRSREMAKLIATEGPALIIGQAGVGKTAFVGHLASQFAAKSVFQGDAIGHGSSHQPFRDWLLDRIGTTNPDYAALAEAFPELATTDRQALALILGLPEGQVLLATLSSLALKGLIEGAIWQAILARQKRGLLLFEDLHWFDVASLGVINHIFTAPESPQFRIILTSREDAKLGRHLAGGDLLTLALDPLPDEDARVLLDRLVPETDAATRRQVLERAGGVPLFLQQLARRGGGAKAGLPATLMDLLGERIDSTGEAKPILQRAAALGRSFGGDMLRALAADGADPLPQLRAAARAGVLVARPNNAWEFAHALLAQAAYQSMLRRTREGLHARIAEMLQSRFPQVLSREPGLLADHQHKARQFLPAIQSYLQASQKLLMQGAFVDGESMARAALGLCAELPEDQRPALEIAAHTMIGSVLMQVQGFTAEPVRQAFDKVLDISSAQSVLGPETAPALLGVHTHAIISAQEARANRLGELMDRMADAAGNSAEGVEIRLVALAARNGTRFYQGNFADQLNCIAAIRPLYRLEKHAGMIARYGMDIFAAAQMFEAPARAILGQTDKVPALVAETDAHQAALSIPVMQPYALVWGSVPLFYAGEVEAAKDRLQRGIDVAVTQGALFWQFIGRTWAFVMDPDLAKTDDGIAGFGQVIATLRAIGANVGVPYFSAVHSARLTAAGRHDEALQVSSRALAETQADRLHCWYPEILRLHAGNCRAAGRAADADAALAKAVEVATGQGAALWLIRAHLDRIAAGGPANGLAEAVARFPNGARLPELAEARSVLAVP